MEFVWWGINVFLGCLFGLDVFHHQLLHASKRQKHLHSGALYAFLTFSSINLAVLLLETIPGAMNSSLYPMIGLVLPLVVLAMSLPLLRITIHSLNVRYTIGGVITVMAGVKCTAFPVYLLAPVLCTVGVMLQYIGYVLSRKKLFLGEYSTGGPAIQIHRRGEDP